MRASAADRVDLRLPALSLTGVSISFGPIMQNSFSWGSAGTVQDSAPVAPTPARRAPSATSRSISWSRSFALLVRSRCNRFLTVFEP